MGMSGLLALFEVGRYPLQVQGLSRTVRYRDKLARLAPGSSLLTGVGQRRGQVQLQGRRDARVLNAHGLVRTRLQSGRK